MKRLLFLGSSCIYPRDCPQPIKEEYLLTGPLEEPNKAYAIAKIAGIEMCASYNQQYGTQFLCAMPTNLYGPGDNYDLNTSHLLSALMRKAVTARNEKQPSKIAWGTGTPRREFLYYGDLADGSPSRVSCTPPSPTKSATQARKAAWRFRGQNHQRCILQSRARTGDSHEHAWNRVFD